MVFFTFVFMFLHYSYKIVPYIPWSEFIEKFVILIIGTILGYFVGGKQEKRRQFFIAAKEFREAFIEEIRILNEPPPNNWSTGKTAHEIIQNASTKHEMAMLHFKFVIKKRKIGQLEKAWKQYRCEEIPQEMNDKFLCYFSSPGDFEQEKTKRKLALQRIHKLLEFAE